MKMLTKPKKACCEISPRGGAALRSGGPLGGESAAQCCAKSSRLVTGCHD